MILSASRRTDIPAFFSEWFFKRIEEGVVFVRNPFNRQQVSKIVLFSDFDEDSPLLCSKLLVDDIIRER